MIRFHAGISKQSTRKTINTNLFATSGITILLNRVQATTFDFWTFELLGCDLEKKIVIV